MATKQLEGLRVQNAKSLLHSFVNFDGTPSAYFFVGRNLPWPNETLPPTPDLTLREEIEVHDNLLSMQSIGINDAHPVIRRNEWAASVVYDTYRHDITPKDPSYSGAEKLYDSNFYVLNSANEVYICLDNNQNSPSTVEPRNSTGVPFFTDDGYQWVLSYKLTVVSMTNLSTPYFIPVIPSETARSSGEITTVQVISPGSDYTDFPEGVSSRVRTYYCNIIGDGTGAAAKVVVDGTSISKVEVVRNGRGYHHASLDFVKGRVYKSLFDMDRDVNGLDPEGNGDFRSRVVINPPGGWRSDIPGELGATAVGVFANLHAGLSDFMNNIDFRQIGILQNPTVTVSDTLDTLSAAISIKVTEKDAKEFVIGEEVTQIQNNGLAKARVLEYDSDNQILRLTQNFEEHNHNGVLYRIGGIEDIVATISTKVVSPDTSFSGLLQFSIFDAGYSYPEYQRYTGELIYLANIPPVRRTENRSEKISIIIKF